MTTIVVTEQGDATVIALRGEHDIATADSLRRTLDGHADRPSVVVDLSDCTFLDCSVVGPLVATAKHRALAGLQFSVARPTPRVARILRMAQVAGVLGVTTN